MHKATIRKVLLAAALLLGLTLVAVPQDDGFEIIYEGVVDDSTGTPQQDTGGAQFDAVLYGSVGMSGAGAFWADGGARASFALGGFSIHADASIGTQGVVILGGVATEIAGFGVAGDVRWTPGNTPIIDLRGWGTLSSFRVNASVRLAGAGTSFALGGTTDFRAFGASATFVYAGGRVAQATVGLNTELGALTVSGSAGMAMDEVTASVGAGLRLGEVNLTGTVGYDGGLGVNAMAGGGFTLGTLSVNAIGLYDNTGIGGEAQAELLLGTTVLTGTGRFSTGGMTVEIGGRFAMAIANVSISVALDDQNGFGWAELGVEIPL